MENNVKGLKKQLVAAIAMVLVAAIALGSSTFAWFVNNDKVTAEGMTVNAQADSSLLIAGSKDENYTKFSSIGTTEKTVLTLKPATSADGKYFAELSENVDVEKSYSAKANGSGDNNALTGADLVTAAIDTNYISAKYRIKSQAADVNAYVSKITISAASENSTINTAIRVAVKIGDVTYVYNPGEGSLVEQLCGQSSDGVTWTVAAPDYKEIGNTDATWSLTKDKAQDVIIYAWFEGQDTSCYTDNISTTGMSITVEFKANPAVQG